jgi:hypothetical protein
MPSPFDGNVIQLREFHPTSKAILQVNQSYPAGTANHAAIFT